MPPIRTTLKNTLDPLNWQVPIANPNGTPTPEFQRKWLEQQRINGSIPDLITAAGISARLDLISSTPGSLLVRGSAYWGGLVPPNDAARFLNGAIPPVFAAVKDSDLSLTDITTNDVSTARHGFAPKAPNDPMKFLDGTGAYSVPAGAGGAASIQDDGTDILIALSDADGQMVLDGLGRPIFAPEVLPESAIPDAAGYATGPYNALVVHKVRGITDGSSPAVGDVGEYLEQSVSSGSPVSMVSGAAKTLTTLTLPPGTWLVWAACSTVPAPSTVTTQSVAGLSLTNNTLPANDGERNYQNYTAASAGQTYSHSVSARRFNVTVNTPVYVVMREDFNTSTLGVAGVLSALRIS